MNPHPGTNAMMCRTTLPRPATTVHRRRPSLARRAFTLIELLIVIAIIALLISIVLPSMGGARRTAWTVICQSNLRQLGIAIQGYLDDQRDPQFPNIQRAGLDGIYWHVDMVDTLQTYLSEAGNKPFDCPAARGLSSVRTPTNIEYLVGGGRIYSLPPQTGPGPGGLPQIDRNGSLPVDKYTEYFFNDSFTPPSEAQSVRIFRYPYGVSGQKIRLIRNPTEVVWATDALDEFPRHEGKGNDGRSTSGKNNLLFGDLRIQLTRYVDYQERPDKFGAPPPFYNWGHLYYRTP